MKANKAPEKIYFNRESIESIPDDDPLFNYLPIKENDDDIEYIRKDVFIEKVCEFIEHSITGYIDVTHKGGDEDVALQPEFIKEFRKYIEEE